MNKRVLWLLVILTVLGGLFALTSTPASAHECTGSECHPTPVYDNWRPQYVPLFGVRDAHDDDPGYECDAACDENAEKARQDAQRWRDEWNCDLQFCVWLGFAFAARGGSPQAIHGGFAGAHDLVEGAHSSEGHGTDEGNHDAHGGAIYFDVCLASEDGTSNEGQAGACKSTEDTQVGVTVMDHNPCGTPFAFPVPVPCIDEYHVVRPLDTDYTQDQMAESQRDIEYDVAHPVEYICGYPGHEGLGCP